MNKAEQAVSAARLKRVLDRGPLTSEGCDKLLSMEIGGMRASDMVNIAYGILQEPSTTEESF